MLMIVNDLRLKTSPSGPIFPMILILYSVYLAHNATGNEKKPWTTCELSLISIVLSYMTE